ncbi:MAG: metal-dependent transcriptional regulator [Crocinitomicaceae bacterium]
MNSQTEENYLKALFNLADPNGEVSISDLSNQLEVSTPTVNSMIKKLHEKNLVEYQKYKPIKLTKEGKKTAALIIRKHRLTEMFLVENMGFGWEEVHEIAEQIEHIQSSKFFDRMDELVGYPSVDPHGSPIPDKKGNIIQKEYQILSKCKQGDKVWLVALRHSSSEFLNFLNNRDLSLDTKIRILSIEEFDGSMVVEYNGRKETLSKTVCDKLMVEKKSEKA